MFACDNPHKLTKLCIGQVGLIRRFGGSGPKSPAKTSQVQFFLQKVEWQRQLPRQPRSRPRRPQRRRLLVRFCFIIFSFTGPPMVTRANRLTPHRILATTHRPFAAAPAKKDAKATGPTDAESREIVTELVQLMKENPGHVLLLLPQEVGLCGATSRRSFRLPPHRAPPPHPHCNNCWRKLMRIRRTCPLQARPQRAQRSPRCVPLFSFFLPPTHTHTRSHPAGKEGCEEGRKEGAREEGREKGVNSAIAK